MYGTGNKPTFKVTTKKEIELFEEYLKKPKKYNTTAVLEFLKASSDENDILRILEVDSRRSVQVRGKHRLNNVQSTLNPLDALGRHYNKSITKSELKKSLKGDSKYINYIVEKYTESRKRNASLKKGYKPEIAPNIRLFNVKWGKDIKLKESMYIGAEVSQIIERGTVK